MPENSPKDNSLESVTPFGQYYLLEKIAQGGMAEIFKGLSYDIHGIKRTVVIKKILPHIAANQEYINMLVSEAKIAVRLSHGNIAQIFDLGKVDNNYFVVMEYVDGKSLSQIHKKCLKTGQLIPIPLACYFISEVAEGLDYMHNRTDEGGHPLKIVHRDISPQNIIVSYSGTVKIIDFGIAKAAFKLDETETGVLKGKFAYMSPEQAMGEEIDGRSDIFSLGVILHELVSGRRLFKEKDNKDTIKNVRRAEVLPPSIFNPEVSQELDKIILKALVKRPTGRFQRAGEFASELTKFLHTKYPDFKPASVVKFLADLFSEELEEREDEKEHTPLLIIDQAQSALKIPELMKQFMLEEEKKEEPSKPTEKIKEEELLFDKLRSTIRNRLTDIKNKIDLQYNKSKSVVVRYVSIAAVLFSVIVVVLVGAKSGLWRAWSEFFTSRPLIQVKEPPPHPKFTTLVVESTPEAAVVFIDDIETIHKTPCTIADFAADGKTHTIGIFAQGYKYWSTMFVAEENRSAKFAPVLSEAFGSLEITSDPGDAIVFINGEKVGTTPFKLGQLKPGTILKIVVEKDGFTSWESEEKVTQDNTIILRPQLMHLSRRPGEAPLSKPTEVPTDTTSPETAPEAAQPKPPPSEIPTLPPAGMPERPPYP